MSFTLSGSRVLFRRTLVAADMMYRVLRRMQLLKLVRMLLLKEVMLGSKRRRQRLRLCCGGKVEASCCNRAALLRHPKGGHVPLQPPPPLPLPMPLLYLFLALVRVRVLGGLKRMLVMMRGVGLRDCSERIRLTPADSSARLLPWARSWQRARHC